MTIPVYLTLAAVKAYWPTNEVSTTTIYDTLITTLCTTLSRVWDRLTFREPGSYAVATDTTRYYNGIPMNATDYLTQLSCGEMAAEPTSVAVSLSGLPTGFVALQSTDYFMYPYNALSVSRPYTQIQLNTASGTYQRWPSAPRSVQVIGKFGYALTLPDDAYEALLLIAVKYIRKSQQNYLDTGTIIDAGQLFAGMKNDPDIRDLILAYRKGTV